MRQVFLAITRVWCRKSFPFLFEMTISAQNFEVPNNFKKFFNIVKLETIFDILKINWYGREGLGVGLAPTKFSEVPYKG